MIFLFFGLVFILAQFYMQGKTWEFTPLIRQILVFCGLVFMLYDTYYYLILPAEFSSFYNSGSGIDVNGQTFFDSTDYKLALYAGRTSQDYLFIDMLFNIVLFGLPVLMVLYGVDWAGKHNFMLGKVSEPKGVSAGEKIHSDSPKWHGN